MNTKRLAELSMLTAAALIVFIVELRFPDLLPIPGVKAGLANIFTVYAVYRFSAKETVLMVAVRIFLGGIFAGNMSALIYSIAGATLCLIGMLLLRYVIPVSYMWLCSVFGAVLHNTGQMIAAIAMTRTFSVLAYYPILIISGCIAGLFTGLCAQLVLGRLRLSGRKEHKNESIGNDEA